MSFVNLCPAGVFSRTRPAGGLGGIFFPRPNSRTNRRSEAGEAAIESPERENSNAYLFISGGFRASQQRGHLAPILMPYLKFSLKGEGEVKGQ